jgi:hypothetical protein
MIGLVRILVPILALSGCTIIRIENASSVKTHLVAGAIRIVPDPSARDLVAYRVRGFGLVPTRNGVTLGWSAEDAVLMGKSGRCRVVVFELPADPAALAAWRDLMAKHDDICLLGESAHEEPEN